MPRAFSTPPHPTVDWNVTKKHPKGSLVQVTCPVCKKARFESVSQVGYRIRQGRFTGHCYADRLLGLHRRNFTGQPAHPAVDWTTTKVIVQGRQRATHVAVICPLCAQTRFCQPGAVAAKIRGGHFTGRCASCIRKKTAVMLGPGRRIETSKGYVVLSREAIPPDEIALFDALRGNRNLVLEHRLVMSKSLGRPLNKWELVDHMDGDKANNELANLRLYRRGQDEPGATQGYGTYYHEWQQAVSRIRELEAGRHEGP